MRWRADLFPSAPALTGMGAGLAGGGGRNQDLDTGRRKHRPISRVVVLDLARACLIVAVATFGAAIVRNVTDALQGIAHHQPPVAVVDRPFR
jgi:hypothetical protein